MRRSVPGWTPTLFALAAVLSEAGAAEPRQRLPEPAPAAFISERGPAAAAMGRAAAVQNLLVSVRLAIVPAQGDPATGWALGATLARYAAAGTRDPHRIESIRDYARRTLAGAATAKLTPEVLVRRLERGALTGIADLQEAASLLHPDDRQGLAAVEDLRVMALLARFHSLRISAGVHYSLFLRAQRLAELVSATYVEKDALQVWRELMAASDRAAAAGARRRPFLISSDWGADLARLEASVRDLEAQCCPPDAALLREKVWGAETDADLAGPRITQAKPPGSPAASPWSVAVHVSAPEDVAEAALRVRRAGEPEFRTLPLRAGSGGIYAAEVPAEWREGAGELQAFVEVFSTRGRGTSFPTPDDAEPYLRLPAR